MHLLNTHLLMPPRAGFTVERIDPLHFLTGFCKRQLNQALFVLSLRLGFFFMSIVLLIRATFCVVLFVCSVSWLL